MLRKKPLAGSEALLLPGFEGGQRVVRTRLAEGLAGQPHREAEEPLARHVREVELEWDVRRVSSDARATKVELLQLLEPAKLRGDVALDAARVLKVEHLEPAQTAYLGG